ncbi:MAG: WG repeat-containing protein [Bacteroidia bacterium]
MALLLFNSCGSEDPHVASDDNWVVVKERGFVGYIDKYGNRKIRTEFAAGRNFSENRAGVNVGAGVYRRGFPLDGKWGFINQEGVIVINPIFDPGKNGILPYKKSDYHLLLSDSYRYAEGLAAIQTNGSWKYINKDGTVVIDGAARIDGMQKYWNPSSPPVPFTGELPR